MIQLIACSMNSNRNQGNIIGTFDNNGFSKFEPGSDSVVIFVSSSEGNDANNGTSSERAVKTLARAAALVRDGQNDFIMLRRGDTWRGESLGRFKSGLDANNPLVITSYGESTERPRIEIDRHFIDHDGHARSFVAVMGLHIVSYPKMPEDPAFDGATGGGFRYIGGGTGLLIEDCHIQYGELVVQSYGGYHYENVQIRRNIIEFNYHVDTCGQNPTYRPSGMYASHVTGLVIEGNIFDHNGWNKDVTSACATMYNHNMYLNANRLIVRENIITRASSIGIKIRSDTSGDVNDLLFENNLLVDGEIGISIGGNTEEANRFNHVIIRRNVFSQIGMGNPTGRNFSWMLDVKDNSNTIIENNHFLHQPWYTNAYGIQLQGNSGSNIAITGNILYNLRQRSIYVRTMDGWNDIVISNNTIVDTAHDSSLIDHNGSFDDVVYQNNRYFSNTGDQWFCVDGLRRTLSQWISVSGETGAVSWTGSFTDPSRTVGTYAATLGLQNTLEAFIAAAKKQNRLNWQGKFTAGAVNDYIRAGFN
ncbi:MAG: hypothetical protein V1874_12235 [Spirochaetota bacterium]